MHLRESLFGVSDLLHFVLCFRLMHNSNRQDVAPCPWPRSAVCQIGGEHTEEMQIG